MALLNLPPAGTGRRKRRDEDDGYGTLDGLAERMVARKKEEKAQRVQSATVEAARKEDERKREDERKAREQKAKDKSIWGKITSTAKDVFSADTEADKARRRA